MVEIKLPIFVGNISELPLHERYLIAASRGATPLIAEILSQTHSDFKFNVNCYDEQGFTALHLACISGYEEIVRILLSNPRINLHILDKFGRHALYHAWLRGNKNIVKLIYNKMLEKDLDCFSIGQSYFITMLFSSDYDIFGTCLNIDRLRDMQVQPIQHYHSYYLFL